MLAKSFRFQKKERRKRLRGT